MAVHVRKFSYASVVHALQKLDNSGGGTLSTEHAHAALLQFDASLTLQEVDGIIAKSTTVLEKTVSIESLARSFLDYPRIPKPHGFSWVLPSRLAGMPYPEPEELPLLPRLNIGLVVTLTEEPLQYDLDSLLQPATAPAFIHLPVVDYSIPTFEQIETFVEHTKRTLDAGKAVVAHCLAGMGRTGTMLACYLVAHENISSEKAIMHVRKRRPGSISTAEQEKIIKLWALRVQCNQTTNGAVEA